MERPRPETPSLTVGVSAELGETGGIILMYFSCNLGGAWGKMAWLEVPKLSPVALEQLIIVRWIDVYIK